MASLEARGAGVLELAEQRFNDHGPLLELDRVEEARDLLLACRAVFEAKRHVARLGRA